MVTIPKTLADKINEYGPQKVLDVILAWERKKERDRLRLQSKKRETAL